MKVKAKCARALIRYIKAKENERENSNELCTTKLYNATCRQRVCGQNKDNLCLHAARKLRARRTLIWRSCAFNRRPMTMPVLDGVKPMAITLPICGTSESLFWKRKKSIYCWTRSRPTWTFGESDDQVRDKSESKYQRVQDKSETIEKCLESGLESETGLEYYSPTLKKLRPRKAYVGHVKKVTAVTWPPVTYLTGPTQAFRGQCINKSLFRFIIILLCKTYSTTLRKSPVTS